MKYCKQCSKLIIRPENYSSGQWENRKYCSRLCSSLCPKNKIIKSEAMKKFYADGGNTVKGKTWKLDEVQIEDKKIRQAGEKNNNWKGGRYDYNGTYTKLRKHRKSVLEHRVIMEQMIGRPLSNKEVVHHWDENKKNNDIINLALLRSRSAHAKLHQFARRHKIPVIALKFNQDWLYN